MWHRLAKNGFIALTRVAVPLCIRLVSILVLALLPNLASGAETSHVALLPNAALLAEPLKSLAPFYPNRGQFPENVLFAGRAGNTAIVVGEGTLTVSKLGDSSGEAGTVSIHWLGASQTMECIGESTSETKVSFFQGHDSSKWIVDSPSFRKFRMVGLYHGIDLVGYISNGDIEFDYVVHPNADPTQIRWTIGLTPDGKGESGFTLASDGSLHPAADPQWWTLKPPISYQTS
jgi:hypothetical protein